MRARRILLLPSVVVTLAALLTGPGAPAPASAADVGTPTLVPASAPRFVDSHGREVVLRGFNVSGEVKLAENGGLPFATVADARKSALAMQQLAGANTVRFLLSWDAAEPTPGTLNTTYLGKMAEQAGVFADLGFEVL